MQTYVGHGAPSGAGEDLFQAFARQSRDGIIMIDSRGSIIEWNPGVEAITGIPRVEALGRPIWEIQQRLMPDEPGSPEHLAARREKVLSGLREGPGLHRVLEEEIQRPDGTRRVMESVIFALPSGARVAAAAICRDVTEHRRLEEDLRQRETLLLETERLVHVGHWDRDLRTGESRWSDEVFRIMGRDPGSFAPSRDAFLEAVAPEDRDRIASGVTATAVDGVTRESEYHVVTARGDVRTVFGTVALLRDERGNPARLIGTAQDITAHELALQRLRTSEERLSLAISAANLGLWDWDLVADTAYLSPEYLGMLGAREPRVEQARTFFERSVHPEDFSSVVRTMEKHLRGESEQSVLEYRMRTSAGVYRWVYGVGRVTARDEQGAPLRMTGIVLDISERKRMECELRAAVRARDTLLAVVSHDLRAPLSTVKLCAEALSRDRAGFGERERKRLELISRSVERMNRLIDDLLDAAMIEAGTFVLELARHDVLPLLDEAVQALEPVAALRAAVIERHVEGTLASVVCDGRRVLQVLSNLIGNASKFGPEGGTIRVDTVANESEVRFGVTDGGPGIAGEHLPHLFDRYWKGSKGRGGAGLGLFISRAIVEAHGGRIWVESRPGSGSTFWFTLPVRGPSFGKSPSATNTR